MNPWAFALPIGLLAIAFFLGHGNGGYIPPVQF
jgi:hypothetical protein